MGTATDKGGSFDAPPVCNPESVPLPNTVCPVPKIGSNSYLFGGCSGKKETETCIFRCDDGFDTPEGVSEKTITCSPNSQGTKVEFSGVPQSAERRKNAILASSTMVSTTMIVMILPLTSLVHTAATKITRWALILITPSNVVTIQPPCHWLA